MSKINLHEMYSERIKQITENDSIDQLNGYKAALNDVDKLMSEMIELLESIKGGYSVYEPEGQTLKIMKKEYPETIRVKEYLQALAEFKNGVEK